MLLPKNAILAPSTRPLTFVVSFLVRRILLWKLIRIVDYDEIDLPVFTCSARDYVRLKGFVNYSIV